MSAYQSFLATKLIKCHPSGFSVDRSELPAQLYEYQRDIVRYGLARGKVAFFTMTGTGKTPMQTAWADAVSQHDGHGSVLMLAPLAVSRQTIKQMGELLNIEIRPCRGQRDIGPGLNIANYEMLHHFSPDVLTGIVLDESSILKAFDGKTRKAITEFSAKIPFRCACSATPSPNDYMELGTHAEFLGVMSYTEMLATFFVHDGGDTSKWRLKGHAEDHFYEWLASWGVFLSRPSDLGYSDDGFELPPLNTYQHIVPSGASEGMLFACHAQTLQERRGARRESIDRRVALAAQIVQESPKPFLAWCDLNDESKALTAAIPGAVEVSGSDSDEHKERAMLDFADGKIDVLVSKPSICGFGMNFQRCGDMAFVGLSDSFESMFQATKRCHRYPRKDRVNRHLIYSEAEGAVYQNVMRKESGFTDMIENMVQHTKKITMENVKSQHREQDTYNANQPVQIPAWMGV